jgi:hypothetical protein
MVMRDNISSYNRLRACTDNARSVPNRKVIVSLQPPQDKVEEIRTMKIDTLSVPTALYRLKTYRFLPKTVQEATAQLRCYLASRLTLRLYRKYFPTEFSASRASFMIGENGYSDCEVEFFHLVDRHHFPLDLDYMFDLGSEGERPPDILLVPWANSWWDEPFDQLQTGWQILLLLSGFFNDAYLTDFLGAIEGLSSEVETEIAEFVKSGEYSLKHLKKLCRAAIPPLCHLGDALALILRETGNTWLDTDPESETPFQGACWCEYHYQLIADAFREARELDAWADEVAAWLEGDLNPRVKRILFLMREAQPKADAKRSTPQN